MVGHRKRDGATHKDFCPCIARCDGLVSGDSVQKLEQRSQPRVAIGARRRRPRHQGWRGQRWSHSRNERDHRRTYGEYGARLGESTTRDERIWGPPPFVKERGSVPDSAARFYSDSSTSAALATKHNMPCQESSTQGLGPCISR
jgi:hypothetical protein